MNILGLYGSCGWTTDELWLHGAGASLWKDSTHLRSISEERLSRIKYDGSFPARSIEYLLALGNLECDQIDVLVYVHNSHSTGRKRDVLEYLSRIFVNTEIEFLDHHQAHACAVFYTSPFHEASILSIDGTGNVWGGVKEYGLYAIGEGDCITVLYHALGSLVDKLPFPLGGYYNGVSYYIYEKKCPERCKGQRRHVLAESTPGKIMGLSAYGDAEVPELEDIFRVPDDSFYFPRIAAQPLPRDIDFEAYSNEDIAAWLQDQFTSSLTDYFSKIPDRFRSPNLCFSGGCALNVIANRALKNMPEVEDLWVFPATNDAGLCFGGAISKVVSLFGRESLKLGPNLASTGKNYSDDEIRQAIQNVLG